MKRVAIFITILISVQFIGMSQNTIDYWNIGQNSITISTKNRNGDLVANRSIVCTNGEFVFNSNPVYLKPDKFADYPSGYEALKKLMINDKDLDCNQDGAIPVPIRVCIIISSTGFIDAIGILKGWSFDDDYKALEFIKKIPKWQFAIKNNVPVNSLMLIPVQMLVK